MSWRDEQGNLRRGRQMRRQPVPEPASVPEKKTWKGKIRKENILVFGRKAPAVSGTAHKVTEQGVYTRPDKNQEVDISRCTFWPWWEIDEYLTEVL